MSDKRIQDKKDEHNDIFMKMTMITTIDILTNNDMINLLIIIIYYNSNI